MKKIRKMMIIMVVVVSFMIMSVPATVHAADGNQIVYITNTGTKYHNAGCKMLKESSTPITLSKAVSLGYTACKICHAPATDSVTATATTKAAATAAASLDANQIVQEAYKDYVAGGLASNDALARVQQNMQALVSLQPANAQTIQQFVTASLGGVAAATQAAGVTPQQVAQQAYAQYVASGMTSAQALAQVQANLPSLLATAGK